MTISQFISTQTGLSYHSLALKLKGLCCRQSVYNIMQGTQIPSFVLFLQICKKLEIPVNQVNAFIEEIY